MPTASLQRGKTPPTNKCPVAQSAGAADNADSISAEGKTPPTSVLIMTRNNLMLRNGDVPLY